MAVNHDTVYLKGDRNVEVKKPEVTLGDIMSMECSNKDIIPKLKTLKILKIPDGGKQRLVISILKIIACIHEKYPGLEIQNMGEQDIIITYEDQKTPNMFFHVVKTICVALITFCGAAFSIMAFNNDVSTAKLFSQIYEYVTGIKSDGFTLLEVTYSIGIVIGILVFFNHFGKKRFTVDPTPMEVQMRLYENDIQTTLIEDAARREQELDVGKSNYISGNRT
ncbi:MAG: stage V sporulation protein AA [Muricomes sp.]